MFEMGAKVSIKMIFGSSFYRFLIMRLGNIEVWFPQKFITDLHMKS